MLDISSRPCASHSSDFEFTCTITLYSLNCSPLGPVAIITFRFSWRFEKSGFLCTGMLTFLYCCIMVFDLYFFFHLHVDYRSLLAVYEESLSQIFTQKETRGHLQ